MQNPYRPTSTNSEQEDKENVPLNDSQTTVTFNDLNITDDTEPQEDPSLPECLQNFVGPYCSTCVNGTDGFVYQNLIRMKM